MACSYRSGYFRCSKRGWLVGRCLTHAADAIRGDWRFGPFHVELDLGRLALPSYTVDDDFDPPQWRSFTFGTDGCDPAFGIHWNRKGGKGDNANS